MPATWQMVGTNNGFDKDASPPWLMVAEDGSKTIELLNAQNMTVTSEDPSVAEVREGLSQPGMAKRAITILGKKKGTTFVRVRGGGAVQASLEVCVKGKKTVKVAFNFVEDSAGHRTTRNISLVNTWVSRINAIYVPQTNIHVEKVSSRAVKVARDLGAVVRYSSHISTAAASEHEWNVVVAKGDGSADFNFFYVWEYEQDATPGTDNTDAGALNGNCIFEDHAGTEVEETMAHELGHYLGVGDFYTTASRTWLMHGYTDVRGRKIPKAHANTMNP